jgi:hypothetical protein
VLESIQAMSLLAIMDIVGPVLLAAGLIYATVQWSRRRRGAMEAVREQATRQLYREGAREESIEGKLDPADTYRGCPSRRKAARSFQTGVTRAANDGAVRLRCGSLQG